MKPYSDALSAQKAQLEGVLSRGFQAISIPASVKQYEPSGMHFLGKSAVVFLVIGAIAFVAGLIIGNMGVIVAGCTALLSGGYLYVKGLQSKTAEGYSVLGDNVYNSVSNVYKQISDQWNAFTKRQNDSLVKSIIGSDASDDDKVKYIDSVEASPAMKFDLDDVRKNTSDIAAKGDIMSFSRYLTQVQGNMQQVINNVDSAMQTVYSSIAAK